MNVSKEMRKFIIGQANGSDYTRINFELTRVQKRQFVITVARSTRYASAPERKAILGLLDDRRLIVFYQDSTSGLIVTPERRETLTRKRHEQRLHKQRNGPWDD